MAIEVRAVDPRSADATRLLEALTIEIKAIYADNNDDGSGGFERSEADPPHGVFVIAYDDGRPVGCGALRRYEQRIGEIKRMFTVPEWRGRGVAAAILHHLERRASAIGYDTMRIETGDRQPGAIRVYERAGYRHIPPFGVYVNFADTVCFEKPLPVSATPALLD